MKLNLRTTAPSHPRGLTAIQVALAALCGCLVGLALAFVGGLAAARLFAGSSGGWGDLIGAVLGSLIGYIIGVALGVYVASRRFGNRRPIWRSLLGSLLGALLVILAAEPLGLNSQPIVLQAAFVVVTPIIAALTFNFTRLGHQVNK